MIGTRRGRVVAAIVCVLATAVGGTALSPAHAVEADDFRVESTTYSAPSVSVGGLQTRLLTVTAHITDNPSLPVEDDYLEFGLTRSGGAGAVAVLGAKAKLVSGIGADGVWAATFPIASTADGTWALTSVREFASDEFGGPVHAVAGAPTFTVIGTHQPRVSMGTSPAVVPVGTSPFTVKGRVTDRDTGLGMPGVRLGYGIFAACDQAPVGGISTVSNSSGYYGFRPQDPESVKTFLNCVIVFGSAPVGSPTPATVPDILKRILRVTLSTWVSAGPSVTTAPIGTIVPVPGKVGGSVGSIFCRVQLQRLRGSTVWRTVSNAKIRFSGRFTLTAQPSVRGPNIYRVMMPLCGQYVAAKSVPFIITGT